MKKECGKGYVGRVPNCGAADIKASHQIKNPSKGKTVKGKDLRSGK